MPPIRPETAGLTPEAMEALGITPEMEQEIVAEQLGDDTSSADEEPDNTNDIVDAIIVPEEPDAIDPPRGRGRSKSAPDTAPRTAKAGPPTLDEWQHFFGRVVLRVVCDWYISWAFRGVDEDELSEREIERIAMSDDERAQIAVPFAELSHKSKFMRKHGRLVVSSGDSFYALVALGAWFSRVNRIANKHKPKIVQGKAQANGSARPSEANGAGFSEGANGGRVPNGPFRVFGPNSG
jgi:hypothetical protein